MSVLVRSGGSLDLAKSTPATATADDVIAGKTAWVNGNLITGNAVKGETVVYEHSGELVHTFDFGREPKAVLVQFGSNGQVESYGKFMKILDVEYAQSSGAPAQSVAFGYTSVTAKFTSSMSSSYTPYIKVTAIF